MSLQSKTLTPNILIVFRVYKVDFTFHQRSHLLTRSRAEYLWAWRPAWTHWCLWSSSPCSPPSGRASWLPERCCASHLQETRLSRWVCRTQLTHKTRSPHTAGTSAVFTQENTSWQNTDSGGLTTVLVLVSAVTQKLDVVFGPIQTQQVLLLPHDFLLQTGVVFVEDTWGENTARTV